MVREPRVLLAEMGCELPADVAVEVWDSSAEQRYLVLPERPAGTDGLTEEELADAGHPRQHDRRRPAVIEDLPRRNGELAFDAPWESRVFALAAALRRERPGRRLGAVPPGADHRDRREARSPLLGELDRRARAPGRRSPVPADLCCGRLGRVERRIFGIENEYGVTCTFRGQRRLSPGRGGALPVPPGRVVGPQLQRLPEERRPALPRRRQPPGVRHPRVRLRRRPGHPRQGRRADARGPARRRRATAPRGGHRRRHLPVQEQHRLGRQLLRLPRELPRRPARRVHPARRRADPVPRHPADHLRRRQGAADPARRRLLRQPAGRAHLGGRLLGDHPQPPDHQHPRRAARRRRALPPAARHRRRQQHERDHHPAQGRQRRPGAADDRGRHRDARPHPREPDPGDPRGQPRPHRPEEGQARQRPRGQRAGDPAGVLRQGHRLHLPARRRRDRQAGARPVGPHPAGDRDPGAVARRAARSTGSSSTS